MHVLSCKTANHVMMSDSTYVIINRREGEHSEALCRPKAIELPQRLAWLEPADVFHLCAFVCLATLLKRRKQETDTPVAQLNLQL